MTYEDISSNDSNEFLDKTEVAVIQALKVSESPSRATSVQSRQLENCDRDHIEIDAKVTREFY